MGKYLFMGREIMKIMGLWVILLMLAGALPVAGYAANTKPTAIPQVVDNVVEDVPMSITLEGVDQENDSLTYKIVGAKPGKGIVTLSEGSNIATYTPHPNTTGSDKFTFTVSDGLLTSAKATVSIMINAVNDAPVASGKTVNLDEDDAGKRIPLLADDPDNTSLIYTIVTPPVHGTITQLKANIATYKPSANYHGTDSFTFTVSDGLLASTPAMVNLVIASINDKPVANSQALTVPAGGATRITLGASDPDGDALTYTIAKTPKPKGSLGSITNGNQVTYTPKAGVLSDKFNFTVKDDKLTSVAATVTLKVDTSLPGSITDPFLLKCFASNPPTSAELTASTLVCDGVDLSMADLSQLGNLPNLRELTLSHAKLTDISGLAGLTKLTRLDLEFNEIASITPLAGMAALTYLNLGFNDITDVTALASMNNLQELYLDANQLITVGTVLANKTALTKLSLDNNKINSISGLSSLSNLTHLGLGYNQVSTVSALAGLTKLQVLALDANYLTSISHLSGVATLQKLYLRGNGPTDTSLLTDIGALSGLTALQELELGFNHISNVTALPSLVNLTRLGLEYNNLASVAALSGLTKLKSLDLEHNQLVSTNGIPDMVALSGLLRLEYNSLLDDDLTALAAMSNSYSLRLDDNCLGTFPFPARIKVYGEDWQFSAVRCGGTTPSATGGDVNILQDTVTSIPLTATDPNGDTLTYKLEEVAVIGGTLNAGVGSTVNGEVVFTPSVGHLKSSGYFKFSVTDSNGEKSPVVTVNLWVVNPMLVSCYGSLSGVPKASDLSGIVELGICSGKNLTDIDGLPDFFPNLTKLFIGGNPGITDYSPLTRLASLNALSLAGTNLDAATLDVVKSLRGVTILELNQCQLDNADIAKLAGLTQLYHLYLNDNDITDSSSLSGLTGLGVLQLGDDPTKAGNNAITDITAIQTPGMPYLQNLILSGNKIGDSQKQADNLAALSSRSALTYLDLDDNGLTGIGGLATIPNLDVLALRKNQLIPTAIDSLKNYPNGLALYVEQNCLNNTDLNSGWNGLVTRDTSGNQCSLVNGVCPPYFDSTRSCAPLPQ